MTVAAECRKCDWQPIPGNRVRCAGCGTEQCQHRWIIDSPDGPYSDARCRYCGAERKMSNVYHLDRDPSHKAISDAMTIVDRERRKRRRRRG